MRISEMQEYFRTNVVEITDVSRMKCSSGGIELVDVDNTFRLRVDVIWTGYWTKKWKALSKEDFAAWIHPKIMKWVEELNPEDDTFHHSIHIIEE